jgi:LysR family hydrogen peroxide-inducible transcriptional activator
MVSSGAGITLLPRLAVAVENRRGQLELRPFAEKKPPSRTIVMAFRPSSPFGETFRTLAKTLRAALGSA